MCKPQLIILSRKELILEAQGKVSVDTLSRSIVIVEESIVVVHIILHLGVLWLVRAPLDVILGIGYVLTTAEPTSAIEVVLSF
jgi:hypothetical protein